MGDDIGSHQSRSHPIGNSTQSNEIESPNPEGSFPNENVIEEDVGDHTESTTQGGRLKSVVWNHFKKIQVNGEDKAQCNYCKKLLGGKSKNGTRHLHLHMESCIQRKISLRGQKLITSKMVKGKQEMTTTIYDPEFAKKELAQAIIMHEYPLSIVDHLGFKKYSFALQPLFKVPSRNTMKKEIFKMYDVEKTVALKLMDTNEGRVAITTDMWTASNQKKGYMAITAHYIDHSWNLQSRILRFIYVPTPHTSERLSTVLVGCLLDWNIDGKLSTITLDNCSTNDSMIEKIKNKLHLGSLLKDGSLLHMRCYGLEVVKDGVEKIRDSVAYWTATPKRVEKFKETTKQLRMTCTKSLCLDCPTRWNSTYKMLDIAISYKEVFCRLKHRDDKYTCLPTTTQWEFASEVCEKLKIFNSVTELFSGTNYPTANLYFPKVCEINLAISNWLTSSNVVIQRMATKMMDKFKCYWSVIHDIMGVATILDPRYKMSLLEYYYQKLYPADAFHETRRIRKLCYDLFSDYELKSKESTSSPFEDINSYVVDDSLNDFDAFVKSQKRAKTTHLESELDLYLEEDILPRTSDFDILMWWKLNGVKYPTLQKIAKDVLAIPISSVASESAFSTGGRILSPHRNRLHWQTLEALMCVRSWLWSEENKGLSSKGMEDYGNLLDEIDFEDEDEQLPSGATHGLEDD
ncbi:Tam3-transposase (Ac family) protein [Dioscorea alata]|uniref:Tam3-transposase (Ac family) protein n=2 Tax=Dioscorea alata TaxID=55571 RepID=A0ACB7URM9_DIOAL|nr:Tam3-transposase (Ac family) protein [Dioscorea alata]KAH7663376.1 Tam3-transposase (Ac family) protein [Dioscorea alata]